MNFLVYNQYKCDTKETLQMKFLEIIKKLKKNIACNTKSSVDNTLIKKVYRIDLF